MGGLNTKGKLCVDVTARLGHKAQKPASLNALGATIQLPTGIYWIWFSAEKRRCLIDTQTTGFDSIYVAEKCHQSHCYFKTQKHHRLFSLDIFKEEKNATTHDLSVYLYISYSQLIIYLLLLF